MDRETYLQQSARAIVDAAQKGVFHRPIQIFLVETIAGPRAGALRIFAGLDSGPLYRALSADSGALARQFVAWPFQGDVSVYLDGRAVRLEAPWPPELMTRVIRLREIARHPRGGGRWVLGIDEIGRTVIGSLSDSSPHWLVAGTTGSGKTTALLGAALQLSHDEQVRLVLIDGKGGAGLAPIRNIPGVVGPIAQDVDAARRALAWVEMELKRRYAMLAAGKGDDVPILVVVFDEFQEFTDDPMVSELMRRIVSRGRAARIHCLVATHHPTVRMFGEDGGAIKRNLPARLALRVLDAKASEVAIGAPIPRADRLTGAGDAYAVVGQIHRVQVALVEGRDLDGVPRTDPLLEEFPEVTAADIGQEVESPRWAYSGGELACGLVAAAKGWGRGRLMDLLGRQGYGIPGAERAIRLLRLGREQLDVLDTLGFEVKERFIPGAPVAPALGTIVDLM